jgi:hypothetical protein
MSRLTFTDRRRTMLARRVESLEAMEPRAMITESLGILSLGIGVPTAVAAFAASARADGVSQAAVRRPGPSALKVTAIPTLLPHRKPIDDSGSAKGPEIAVVAAPARKTTGGDWLTFGRRAASSPGSGLSSPPKSPAAKAGGAAVGRGGGGSSGLVTPLRLPPPIPIDAGSSTTNTAVGLTTAASPLGYSPPAVAGQTPAGSSQAGAASSSTSFTASPALSPSGGGGHHKGLSPTLGNSSPVALGSFTHFPLYTLDYNDGTVLFPGVYQEATLNAPVDLRAQVRDTTVSSYSWDTTHLGGATSITGTSTYNLKFKWTTGIPEPQTSSVTLTVTNNSSQQEIQTYTFALPVGSVSGSGGSSGTTWPESLAPDLNLPAAPAFATHNAAVAANTGALDATIPLPAYNPNLPALALTYDSLVADARPIVVEHHTIDPTLAIPTKVSGQLTFNGTTGTAYYYDTSQFIPGDIEQIALQADATGLSTGRYAYTVTVGDVRGTTTTTTATGTATVLRLDLAGIGADHLRLGRRHPRPGHGGQEPLVQRRWGQRRCDLYQPQRRFFGFGQGGLGRHLHPHHDRRHRLLLQQRRQRDRGG